MQPRFQGVANPKSHFVRTERLPLNPFRRQRQVLAPSVPEIEEGSYEVATRIESIFASVFDLGDQQQSAARSIRGRRSIRGQEYSETDHDILVPC